jgi:TetR/AcrR family transcriptional regulator, mexCD-oprJ operon repressor
MGVTSTPSAHRAVAERNIEEILDATERLLRRGEQPTVSAVAAEAAVSRPTVYAHFEDRRTLLEALVTRTVRRATSAISASEPQRGPAAKALSRLIATSWRELAHHDEIAHAAMAELSAEAMHAAHASAREMILELVERGRRDGSFRTDVPASWLVTTSLALVHATVDEVRRGQFNADAAPEVLSLTIGELFRKSTAQQARAQR